MFDAAIFQTIHDRHQFLNLDGTIPTQKNILVGSCQQRLPDALVEHVDADGFVTEKDPLILAEAEGHSDEEPLVGDWLGATRNRQIDVDLTPTSPPLCGCVTLFGAAVCLGVRGDRRGAQEGERAPA